VLQFRILGPLEVERDGELVRLGGKKQRALLALLLVHAGELMSADRLVDELWGEQPPRTALTSLQNNISQLRKALGAEVVATQTPGYVLKVDDSGLDALRFERLVAQAKERQPRDRARVIREALAMWRGPPLADFAYEGFAQGAIHRLEELRLVALEDRIDADLDIGMHAEIVAELESLVREHPLRERFRAQLMLALYRAGRQAEALQAYQEARRALVEELGIEPSSELQHLHSSILRQESALETEAAPRATPDHLDEVARAILSGRVVPVLGPEASLSPGADVASYLAEKFGCPPEHRGDLARVAQFVAVTRGVGPLYDELHALYAQQTEPTPVHSFLTELAPILREHGVPQQLLATSGYGRVLERAFEDAGEEIDVVSYIAVGRDRGRFCHRRPDGSTTVIEVPNTYTDLSLDERTVILKIHGDIDPPARERESFVVSEDDYIAYLAQTELTNVIPVTLAARLVRSHFLFLGYPLLEWNLRVFLHRVFGDEAISYRSWAVHSSPAPLDREFWRKRDVDVIDAPLDEYVGELAQRLREAVAKPVAR